MADTKISDMTAMADGVLADADEFAVADATALTSDLSVTALQLRAYLGTGLRNAATAAQSPAAATSTYLTGSNIAVPVGKLRVGTVFRWHLTYTKTAAGTAARNFFIRIGTAGTTADTAVITLLTEAGTAATDVGYMMITMTVRGPLSASCIFAAGAAYSHNNSGTTGLSATNEVGVLDVISSAFDATTANLIVGLSCTTGAAEVLTFDIVTVEAFNL